MVYNNNHSEIPFDMQTISSVRHVKRLRNTALDRRSDKLILDAIFYDSSFDVPFLTDA